MRRPGGRARRTLRGVHDDQAPESGSPDPATPDPAAPDQQPAPSGGGPPAPPAAEPAPARSGSTAGVVTARALREPSERVDPRARTMWRVTALIEAGVVVVVLVVLAVLGLVPWWVAVLVGAVGVVWSLVVPHWRYLVHRWEVTGTAVYTQTGWWARERRIAPMSRIQTVDLAEGAIARLFRLATVTVTTASAAGALEIAGLDAGVARRLVADLAQRADAVEGDAT